MELPKNITQIGEADKHCRIYVEDYVVSYIKQMNGMAQSKDIAIALYGRKTAEDGVAYLFAYGSAKLNFLQKPVRHLSQAQEQEIEKLRRKYFSEMTFLGYQILNGEMVEGWLVWLVTGSENPEVVYNATLYLKVDTLFYYVTAVICIVRNAMQGLGERIVPLISSSLEMIGKIVIAATLVPMFGYLGVIAAEPIVWFIMIIPLLIKILRMPLWKQKT